MLEKSLLGYKIHQTIISGLLYVDDLILVRENKGNLKTLLNQTQILFEKLGLTINCEKSQIMSVSEMDDIELASAEGEILGTLKRVQIYKYLGVYFNIGRASNMFKDAK